MSKAAWKHVRQLEAQRGDGLSGAEVRVLRAVASYHHVGVSCSFATVAALADEAQMSARNFQRLAGKLCEKGVLRRYSAQRDCNASQTSNEYELVGLDDAGASTEIRSRVFNVKRSRREFQQTPKAVQMRLPKAVGHADEFAAEEGKADSSTTLRNHRQENQSASPEAAPVLCKSSAFVTRGGDTMSSPGVTPCHPVESYEEWNEGRETPYAPLGSAPGVEEKLPDRGGSSPGSGEVTQRAAVAGDRGANVLRFPGRQRRKRGLGRVDVAKLDGFELVLHEETTRVLRECDVSPVSVSRKWREAVSEALRLRCESSGRAVGDAAQELITSWRSYRSAGSAMCVSVGLRRFCADGLWLNSELWPWTSEARAKLLMVRRW